MTNNLIQLHKHAYLDKKDLTLEQLQKAAGTYIYIKNDGIKTYKGYYNNSLIFRGLVDVYGKEKGFERILPERIVQHENSKPNDKIVTSGSQVSVGFTPFGFDAHDTHLLTGDVIVCAGMAEGFRLFECKNIPVFAGVGENNIPNLCEQIRLVNPNVNIIAYGDADAAGIYAVHSAGTQYVIPKTQNDFSDIYQIDGAEALSLQANDIREPLPLFPDRHYPHKLERQILKNQLSKNINKLSRCKDMKEAAELAYSILCKYEFRMPFEYDINNLVKEIILSAKHTLNAKNINDLKSIINMRIGKRKRQSLSLTNFDKYKVKKKHNLYELPGLPQLTDRDFNGVLLFRAEKGIGKTIHIGKPFVEAKQNSGLTLAVCHRMSLTEDLSNRLKLHHYQKDAGRIKEVLGLACCLPSIAKPKFSDFIDNLDFIFIDEIAQVLDFLRSRHCSSGAYDNIKTNADIYNKLTEIVTNAKCVVGVDAELNDRVIQFIEQARPKERFHVYDINEKHERKAPLNFKKVNTHISTKKNINYVIGDSALSRGLGDMLTRVKEGQNLWVAAESTKRTTEIGKYLENNSPGVKVLVLNADTKDGEEQAAFFNNPDKESLKYNVVIHSPVISSGVSVEHRNESKKHFHHTYFMGGGFTITPSHASQMLARVRYVHDCTLILFSNNRKSDVRDARSILIGKEQASYFERQHADATEFDRLCAQIQHDEDIAKSDFVNGLLWLLDQEGHKLTPLTGHYESLEIEIKQLRDEAKEDYNRFIIQANDIDTARYFELKNNSQRTFSENMELQKYYIKDALNIDKVTPYDIDLFDGGRLMSKMRRYSAMYHRTAFEEKEVEHLSQRKFSKAKVWAYDYLFKDIDISPNKRITQEHAKIIIKRVIKKRYMLAELGVVPARYARYLELTSEGKDPFPMPKSPMKDVQSIFRAIGVEMDRKDNYHNDNKINDYQIPAEKMELLEEIHTQIDFSRWGGYTLYIHAGSAEIEHENWQLTKNLVVQMIDVLGQAYTARHLLDSECKKMGIDSSQHEVKQLYDKIRMAGG